MTNKDAMCFIKKMICLIFGYTLSLGILLGFILGFICILCTPI